MRRPPGVFRRILALLPARHRRLYESEIWEVVCHRWVKAGGGSRASAAALWDLVSGVGGVWMDHSREATMEMTRGWLGDLRFVVRSLWKSRGYVVTATAVLACAVAANATVYSYVRGTLLARPSYPDPAGVAIIWGSNLENGQRRDVISGPNFIDLHEGLSSVEAVSAFHYDGTYIEVDGRPEVLGALEVTVDFLSVLRVAPALGRFFDEADRFSGGPESIVVTHAFWQDRLGGDPSVIGSTLVLEDSPRTVIGVLPADYNFIAPAPILLPLRDDELAADNRGRIHYHLLARLGPGATLTDLQLDLDRSAREITAEYSGFEGWSFRAERLDVAAVEAVRPIIVILLVTVTLVLLVALTNLATLFRVRTAARRGEVAVRTALGAGRLRLARVLTMEPLLIATLGALIGLAATPWILAQVAEMVPLWVTIPDSAARVPVVRAQLDQGVALVALFTSIAGALALTAPALRSLLATGSRQMSVGRAPRTDSGIRLFVGLELAITTVLCVGASLLVRSLDHLLATDVGIEAEGLLTVRFGDVWGLEPGDRVAYFERVTGAVEQIPGVRSAAVIDYVDFLAEDDFARVDLLDRTLQARSSVREEWRRIDDDLFATAGMTLLAGRGFSPDDMTGAPRVAVVNRSFARKHFAEGDPLGRLISTHDPAYQELRVVGVVADVHSLGPVTPPPPMLYVPNQGSARGTLGLYVRVEGDPMALSVAVRDAVWSVDASQPVIDVVPMASLVESWVAIPRAARSLVVSLAVLAWLLSTLGVFGVVSYTVRTRRAELGVRVALGASPRRLERDQLIAASPVIILGVGAGLIAAIAAARGASALLFGVSPLDPVSLFGGVAATTLAAVAATYLPARRAGRADPRTVLRTE